MSESDEKTRLSMHLSGWAECPDLTGGRLESARECMEKSAQHIEELQKLVAEQKQEDAWIVSTGEYSAYLVVAVCASKEVAEEFIAKIDPKNYSAEKIPYWSKPPEISEVLRIHCTYERETGEPRGSPFEHVEKVIGKSNPVDHHMSFVYAGVFLMISGTDHDRVRKVWSEKKAEAVHAAIMLPPNAN